MQKSWNFEMMMAVKKAGGGEDRQSLLGEPEIEGKRLLKLKLYQQGSTLKRSIFSAPPVGIPQCNLEGSSQSALSTWFYQRVLLIGLFSWALLTILYPYCLPGLYWQALLTRLFQWNLTHKTHRKPPMGCNKVALLTYLYPWGHIRVLTAEIVEI